MLTPGTTPAHHDTDKTKAPYAVRSLIGGDGDRPPSSHATATRVSTAPGKQGHRPVTRKHYILHLDNWLLAATDKAYSSA